MVGERPRAADPDEDHRALPFGQQIADVALLVAMAAVNQRVLAEHVLDRLAQRFAAVDHEQDRLLGIQAAVNEVGKEHRDQRRVLGAAFLEP